ncbi:hypothetical protein GC194_09495 [bacterium]|nr:hypothetical protein [bacterium]
MKHVLLTVLLSIGMIPVFGQTDSETLRKAIGYYQQLKFEKSIELFDQLVAESPDDYYLLGRRGFVIAEFIKAIDENKVEAISEDMYLSLVKKGIEDLKKSLEKLPGNADNKQSLTYLQSKG